MEKVYIDGIEVEMLEGFVNERLLNADWGREVINALMTMHYRLIDGAVDVGYRDGIEACEKRHTEITTSLPRKDKLADIWDKTGGGCWYCGVYLNPFRDL